MVIVSAVVGVVRRKRRKAGVKNQGPKASDSQPPLTRPPPQAGKQVGVAVVVTVTVVVEGGRVISEVTVEAGRVTSIVRSDVTAACVRVTVVGCVTVTVDAAGHVNDVGVIVGLEVELVEEVEEALDVVGATLVVGRHAQALLIRVTLHAEAYVGIVPWKPGAPVKELQKAMAEESTAGAWRARRQLSPLHDAWMPGRASRLTIEKASSWTILGVPS
jgi:hypothetical protein